MAVINIDAVKPVVVILNHAMAAIGMMKRKALKSIAMSEVRVLERENRFSYIKRRWRFNNFMKGICTDILDHTLYGLGRSWKD